MDRLTPTRNFAPVCRVRGPRADDRSEPRGGPCGPACRTSRGVARAGWPCGASDARRDRCLHPRARGAGGGLTQARLELQSHQAILYKRCWAALGQRTVHRAVPVKRWGSLCATSFIRKGLCICTRLLRSSVAERASCRCRSITALTPARRPASVKASQVGLRRKRVFTGRQWHTCGGLESLPSPWAIGISLVVARLPVPAALPVVPSPVRRTGQDSGSRTFQVLRRWPNARRRTGMRLRQ